jgi:hypothetical protein
MALWPLKQRPARRLSLDRRFGLTSRPNRGGDGGAGRVDPCYVNLAHADNLEVSLAPNHILIQKFTIAPDVALRLRIGCDRSCEIRGAEPVILLRGLRALRR